MHARRLSLFVVAIVFSLIAFAMAGAVLDQTHIPMARAQEPAADLQVMATSVVTSAITYQGRLTDVDGNRLNGARDMRFIIYDDAVAGAAQWDSGVRSVGIVDGLFTVQLNVDPAIFDGRALWMSTQVAGETLSPRQEILPSPYALSLRPGADIVGDAISATDAVLAGYAPATGTALYAQANGGAGLFANSNNTYGVWGSSLDGWGGYFTSNNGYGIRVDTKGNAHFDHGAYVTSASGYAVYAQSASNQGIRGEAGDVSSIGSPSGTIGVVGIGENRGVAGYSNLGPGLYGLSQNSYAGYFFSDDWHTVFSSSPAEFYAGMFTNRGGSSKPGIFVNGTMMVTGSKSGYVVDITLNVDQEELEVGDIVAVVGVAEPVVGDIPVMRVVKASEANASAVVGIVDQRFLVDDEPEEGGVRLARPDTVEAVSAAGTGIQKDEYLSVVTLGAYKQVKVDASFGAIQPGDLLTPSANPGYARLATEITPGTIIGKALDALESGKGVLPVYVTMQ